MATSAASRKRRVPIDPHLTTLDALNGADEPAFVGTLGFVFEDSPWVAARSWPLRPFGSVEALHASMCSTVRNAPLDVQLALVKAHPDLVGRAAGNGMLTPASTAEQHGAGLDRLSQAETALVRELNAAYRRRFGFPFVICVREKNKAAIVSGLQSRLNNDRATELRAALAEIEKIARLRLLDVIVR